MSHEASMKCTLHMSTGLLPRLMFALEMQMKIKFLIKINYVFELCTQTYGSVLRSDDSKSMNNKIYQE